MEGVHEESFLTQTPSKISRRYSPMNKSEYSGYRPPDPVFLSYSNTETTNTFLPEPLAKHKTIEDIDKVQVNNKFVVNKLSSTTREAAIAPEALELINILNPVEAREIQNNIVNQEIRAEKYTSSITPIEVKKLETKTNTIVQNSSPIVIGKPKILTTYNQINNNTQANTELTDITKNEVTEVETTGPTFTNNVKQITNQNPVNITNIEVKKPVVTPKISQYTNTIDFNSFVSSSFAEIVDQKTEQKLLSRNNINVKKLVTDINVFLEQNKREFKNNISSSVNQFFSTYSEENISSLQNSILNVIDTSNNIQNLDVSVSKVISEYFSKNENEFTENLVTNFINNFNLNLQNQLSNLQQNSSSQLNTIENINLLISDIKNIYDTKQSEIEKIISEVNNDNVLTKVVELANTYQDYKTLSTSSINALSSQVNQTNISEIKETFNKQINSMNVRNESSLSTFKQELYGFLYSYLSSSVDQETFNNLLNSVTTSINVEQVNSIINGFVSNNRTENNSQVIDSLQYFSNDKYSNIVSSTIVETIKSEILNSLSSVVQSYSNQDVIQNSLVKQVKNELAQTLNTEINNTVNSFGFTELKTSIENVYRSQDINEFKSEFSDVLNKSENSSNTQLISYLNDLLENNISQYNSKSVNVLNETRYANSVKNLVNQNLHNVLTNIVHNLSEVNTYSDNKNISTLISNIKIINDRFLTNNADNRLQNFNLIQTSIENFLNNTENSFASSLSSVKTNQNSYSSEIVENLSTFDLLSSSTSLETLTEIKNLINNFNSQSFNEESNKFIQEAKIYTDLVNMKNQITSELNNFVNTTFETILEVNQSSTVVSSQQILNLIEEAVSTFNSSSVSNKALSYIQNTIQDAKKPELYNNTFQLITSTNILEDQVKNYLLKNNSVLADYSLQQILNLINQPVYSDYVTFQDIKEIINNTTSTSSFGILSEIKQYISQVNSQENAQFISDLKTYLTENKSNQNFVNNTNFTEELKSFISNQNSYSPETFNQIINLISNKFENKSALILNQLINENVTKLNQAVETLYSSISSNESKESILNTLSTFINNNSSFSDLENNLLTEQTNSFKLENNDFIENLNNILLSNNNTLSEEIKNDIKNQIFNNISSQVLAIINKNDINSQQISNIIQSSNAVEIKTSDIKNYLTELENVYQDGVFVSEIKHAQSFLKNESTKIDVLNTPYNLNNTNLDSIIQNSLKNNIENLIINKSFVDSINNFRTQISNVHSADEINKYSNNQKTIILNDAKNILNDFISVVKPEYLTVENLSTINSATSIEQLSNTLSENKSRFNFSENTTISNILNQSTFYSEIIESVTKNILNDNNFTENILMQKVDNALYESIQKQINNVNDTLIKNIILNIEQLNISEFATNQEINSIISSSINNTLTKQEVYLNDVLNSFNINNINQQINTYNQEVIKSMTSAVQNYDVSKLLTNTINENISLNQNIVNNDVIENVNQILEKNNYSISDLISVQRNLMAIEEKNINAENNLEINQNIINKEVIEKINNIVKESFFNVLRLNTNQNFSTIESQNIVNNDVVENVNQILEKNNYNITDLMSVQKNLLTVIEQNVNVENDQDIQNIINNEVIEKINNIVKESNFYVSTLNTNQNFSTNQSQSIFNYDIVENVNQVIEKNNYDISDLVSIQRSLTAIQENTINSEEAKTIIKNIFNSENIEKINNFIKDNNLNISNLNIDQSFSNIENKNVTNNQIVENLNKYIKENSFDISSLNTYQAYSSSENTNILNNEIVENLKQVLDGTNVNTENYEEVIKNFLSSQTVTQQIQNIINSNIVRKLFSESVAYELEKGSSTVRDLLEEKTTNNQVNLFSQFISKNQQSLNEIKASVNNEVKNEVERIENITLNFENQSTYQKSSIQVYDEVTNKIEASLPDGFNKVSTNEAVNISETNNTNNDFRNITVVKQIDENEDVQISNLRIEKVWNKFVQEEVNKIVEQVNNHTESTNQENIYNQENTTVNQNSKTENFNKSEFNYNSGDVHNTENKSVYNTYNTPQPGLNTTTKETEERVDYREITELVFTRIEEKLKTFSVTEEDIIILKHKILSEVTEIYEKKSRVDIQKSEEKMKKEMQDLFIKFLNS